MRFVPVCVWLASMVLGCGLSSNSDDQSGTITPAACDQGCQDRVMAVGISQTIWFLYNQNIPGSNGGIVQKKDIACPLGGTVSYTGTASTASNGITQVNVTYDLAGCRNAGNTYSVALTGKVNQDGTFSSAGTNVTMHADAVVIAGTVKTDDQPAVQESCAATVTDQRGSSNTGTLKGTLCGRDFFATQ